ncbi:MAG: methyl-accepting chemotaxis protein [Desulfobulbus sp.]
MFKNISIKSQLTMSFGLILALLVLVAFFSWKGLSGMSDGIREYDRKAVNFTRVNSVEESLLIMQAKVKDFFVHHQKNDLQMYHQRLTELRASVDDGLANIKNRERSAKLHTIQERVQTFDNAFAQMVADIEQSEHLAAALRDLGPSMQKNLNSATAMAQSGHDIESMAQISQALQHMLLTRLYAQKFMATASTKDAQLVIGENSQFQTTLAQLLNGSRGEMQSVLAKALDEAQQYKIAFDQFSQSTTNRQMAYDQVLTPIGSEITRLMQEIRTTHIDEQRTIGNSLIAGGNTTIRTMVAIAGTAILLGIGFSFLLARIITYPILQATAFANQMAGGDLTSTIQINRRDEIGQMAESLNRMGKQMELVLKEIISGVGSLALSSNDLATVSQQLSSSAKETAAKSSSVAAATEEMSANFQAVSAAMEQSNTNVTIVASATEEMTATAQEIIDNAAKAKDIADKAVHQSQHTSQKMATLGESAQRIGHVTETITEISEQTNLLALNATIEAARAGEAGKGFAVVANEIKELARQTAEATVDIKHQIGDMQRTAQSTIEDIEKISEVIVAINTMIHDITTAMEEQSMATNEIATNIAQTSQGITEVTGNVAESSSVVGEIAREISGVYSAADEIAVGSSQVNINAHDLQKLADKLAQSATRFTIGASRFDIAAVKGAHLQWRSKLEGVLNGRGTLRPEEVASHHECSFGRWLSSPEGQALQHLPLFVDVTKHHENIHTHAKNIVAHAHDGDQNAANRLMMAFEEEREKFFQKLDDLYLH